MTDEQLREIRERIDGPVTHLTKPGMRRMREEIDRLKRNISSLEAALAVAREDTERLKWCFGDLDSGATREYIESILMHADTVEAARKIIDRLRALAALEGK